jgi:hypothetical protein
VIYIARKICPKAVRCNHRKPICPNCEKKIDHLNMYEKGEKKTMLMVADGEPVWEEINFYPSDDERADFECPECNEILTHKSEDAIKILKGKKIRR